MLFDHFFIFVLCSAPALRVDLAARGAIRGEPADDVGVPQRGLEAAGHHHLVEEGKVHGKGARRGKEAIFYSLWGETYKF